MDITSLKISDIAYNCKQKKKTWPKRSGISLPAALYLVSIDVMQAEDLL